MAITELPTEATFGGPKESLRTLAASAKRQSAANQNAVNDWLIKLATAVGEDDGSTADSLRAADLEINDAIVDVQSDISDLQSTLSSFSSAISGLGVGVQIVSTATATITTARLVFVTYTAGNCTLTLPSATTAREMWIVKANTSTRDIILARSADDVTASGTINGATASLTLGASAWANNRTRFHLACRATTHWECEDRLELVAIENTIDTLTVTTSSHTSTLASHTTQLGLLGSSVQYVTGTTATITTARFVIVDNALGATLTLPTATTSREIHVYNMFSDDSDIVLDPPGAETINGAGGNYTIRGGFIAGSLTTIVARDASTWHVADGTWSKLNDADLALVAADAALDARVTALEATTFVPTTLAASTATASWTTQAECDVSYAAGTCTVALDANTTQWPVGVSRPLNKVNTSSNTIVLDPQGTHTINGLAANTNVTLMNSAAVPGATTAAGVWRIKRTSSTAWWVQ